METRSGITFVAKWPGRSAPKLASYHGIVFAIDPLGEVGPFILDNGKMIELADLADKPVIVYDMDGKPN